MTRSRSTWFSASLVALIVAGSSASAYGQTPKAKQNAAPKTIRPGNVCLSNKLTGGAGIVKVDLCGRAYCGSTSVNEPFQKIDYDRKRVPCEFTLVDNRCRCIPIGKR